MLCTAKERKTLVCYYMESLPYVGRLYGVSSSKTKYVQLAPSTIRPSFEIKFTAVSDRATSGNSRNGSVCVCDGEGDDDGGDRLPCFFLDSPLGDFCALSGFEGFEALAVFESLISLSSLGSFGFFDSIGSIAPIQLLSP